MNDIIATTDTSNTIDSVVIMAEDDTPVVTRSLPCPLSQDELTELGDKIDALIGEAEDLELEAKSSASDFRARLAKTAEQIARLSRQRRGRVIDREVEVSVTQDLARAEEIVTRLDTNDVVSKRTLSRAELADLRQIKIPSVSETGHPEPKAEVGDPWAGLPAPLLPTMTLVDGEAADWAAISMAELRALAVYAKEKGIPATDDRRQTIGTELAKRKKADRAARERASETVTGESNGSGAD